MKVSKKRLIEIVTEEITRTMKEVHGDWWTTGKYRDRGYKRRRNDPHHIHRAEATPAAPELPPEPGPGDSNYDQGKEDALAQRDNFDHTTATWKPGTWDNIQPNRPQPRSTPEDRAYMKGYMHYLYRKDLDETMQEGYRKNINEPGRGMSRNERIEMEKAQALEDAETDDMNRDDPYYEKDYPEPRIEDLRRMGITGRIPLRGQPGPLPSEHPQLSPGGVYWVRRWEMREDPDDEDDETKSSLSWMLRNFQTTKEMRDKMMQDWNERYGSNG